MRKWIGELIALVLVAGIGVAYFVETYGYRLSRFERTGGAGVYPRAVLVCLFIFIGLRIIQIGVSAENKRFVFFNLFYGRKGAFFAMFLSYVLLIPVLGYLLATAAYLVVSSCYLTYLKKGHPGTAKQITILAGIFILITLGIYQFFVVLLDVAVPAGLLGVVL